MDAEISNLLKKRQNGYLTDSEKIRLQELIDTREAIEIKYNLSPNDGAEGFDTIAQKLEAEVARAQARGLTDAPVEVYENALVACAEGIKARFLDAFNALVSDKERLLDECRTMQAALTDTGSLDSEIAALLSEMEVVAELTKRCIEENSTTAQDQTAYLERYNGLAERYETAKAKLEKLQAEKAQREAKAEDIGGFMFELAEYGESLTEFDDRLWLTVIDTVTVHRDGQLTFKFQTGHEMLE